MTAASGPPIFGCSAQIVKTTITVCLTSLLLAACSHIEKETPQTTRGPRHLEPERRSTEAEIRQHIVGEWTVADGSDGCWYPTLIIGDDRTLVAVQTNGNRAVIGTWELDRTALRVTPTPAMFKAARQAGYHLNEWDYYPVMYADDHELVMGLGISVAGRWRYKR